MELSSLLTHSAASSSTQASTRDRSNRLSDRFLAVTFDHEPFLKGLRIILKRKSAQNVQDLGPQQSSSPAHGGADSSFSTVELLDDERRPGRRNPRSLLPPSKNCAKIPRSPKFDFRPAVIALANATTKHPPHAKAAVPASTACDDRFCEASE